MRCEYCSDYTCLERRSAGDCLKERPDHQWKITTSPDSVVRDEPPHEMNQPTINDWAGYRNEVARCIFQELIKSDDIIYDLKRKAKLAVDGANELVFAIKNSKYFTV